MCRMTLYKGRKMRIEDVIIKPENSLLKQSRDAAWHPGVDDPEHHRNIRVNGDGFGVAWYGDNASQGACALKFITPAWSNGNLRDISETVRSAVIFGHVRAASDSVFHPRENPMIVSYENCHPFKHGRWTCMHNGAIPEFHRVKLLMLSLISEELYSLVRGTTDSEHVFALFLHILGEERRQADAEVSIEDFICALEITLSTVLQLLQLVGVSGAASLNMCFTNGTHIIATRFRGSVASTMPTPGSAGKPQPPRVPCEDPPSLYYSAGCRYDSTDGCFRGGLGEVGSDVEESGEEGHDEPEDRLLSRGLVISSAPLGREVATKGRKHWRLIPPNCMLVCEGDYADPSTVLSLHIKRVVVGAANEQLEEVVGRYLHQWHTALTDRGMYAGRAGLPLLQAVAAKHDSSSVVDLEAVQMLSDDERRRSDKLSPSEKARAGSFPDAANFYTGSVRTIVRNRSASQVSQGQGSASAEVTPLRAAPIREHGGNKKLQLNGIKSSGSEGTRDRIRSSSGCGSSNAYHVPCPDLSSPTRIFGKRSLGSAGESSVRGVGAAATQSPQTPLESFQSPQSSRKSPRTAKTPQSCKPTWKREPTQESSDFNEFCQVAILTLAVVLYVTAALS